jgi:hypothetical protein
MGGPIAVVKAGAQMAEYNPVALIGIYMNLFLSMFRHISIYLYMYMYILTCSHIIQPCSFNRYIYELFFIMFGHIYIYMYMYMYILTCSHILRI